MIVGAGEPFVYHPLRIVGVGENLMPFHQSIMIWVNPAILNIPTRLCACVCVVGGSPSLKIEMSADPSFSYMFL
jgi:hypothetical protein